jgi:hypothetical protein
MLIDLGFKPEPAVLHVDNMTSVTILSNPAMHGRSRHFDIRLCKIREVIRKGMVKLKWISGSEQVADLFTKPLHRVLFVRHASKLVIFH